MPATDNQLPFDGITTREEAATPKNITESSISAADEACAVELARSVIDEIDEIDEIDSDSDDDGGVAFGAMPARKGEFTVKLSELGEWRYHPRRGSRLIGAHAPSLALTAVEPAKLPTLVVLPRIKGIYPIVNGRFVWAVIAAANEGNEDVEVRCVLFDGTEEDAVVEVSDAALGTVGYSAMEQAQTLLNLQRLNNISQTAIATRYQGLTITKVSNMVIAAKTREAFPMLFDLLIEPDRAPVSYGVELNKFYKTMGAGFKAVLDRADDLIADHARFKPAEAFDALLLQRNAGAGPIGTALPKAKPVATVSSEPIFGDDDAPIGAYERLSDNLDRIRLPDADTMATMSPTQIEAAAEACIAQVRRHFGLDLPG